MRLLHYLEIENFKRFGDRQRIELDHPAVLIGPNNCGKSSAIQAIALWSQAIKTWHDAKSGSGATERTATSLNRLNILSVPVQRTRYFWHNTSVRKANAPIYLVIALGVQFENKVHRVGIRFRNQGDDIVYCTPDDETINQPKLIAYAASLNVELLYPMSGMESEEPVLQPGRIDVLLGQGQTAQVLRNLCLMVFADSREDWRQVADLTNRLFSVELGEPRQNSRGSIELYYRQKGSKEPLDLAVAGRGLQQMLLIFAYLYSHKRSILLIDEPDAHLEILRQKQVYVLLREIADRNGGQVVIVTHSEVILDEALDSNLTLLLDGTSDDLAKKKTIKDSLRHFGAAHYIKARERGYVLYLEGNTDLDCLRALAERMGHPVMDVWDERPNLYYVRDNFPSPDLDSQLERVEGGFGTPPARHFYALREMLPSLRGLAILDKDDRNRKEERSDDLSLLFWQRYEIENYFITPELLKSYAIKANGGDDLFQGFEPEINEVLEQLILEYVFDNEQENFDTWRDAGPDPSRLIWDTQTKTLKMSRFAELFFERLAARLGHPLLLRKGEFHRMIGLMDPQGIPKEVASKLDRLQDLFQNASPLPP
jgi:predicted ATPase